jgi:hypothetical protein
MGIPGQCPYVANNPTILIQLCQLSARPLGLLLVYKMATVIIPNFRRKTNWNFHIILVWTLMPENCWSRLHTCHSLSVLHSFWAKMGGSTVFFTRGKTKFVKIFFFNFWLKMLYYWSFMHFYSTWSHFEAFRGVGPRKSVFTVNAVRNRGNRVEFTEKLEFWRRKNIIFFKWPPWCILKSISKRNDMTPNALNMHI